MVGDYCGVCLFKLFINPFPSARLQPKPCRGTDSTYHGLLRYLGWITTVLKLSTEA